MQQKLNLPYDDRVVDLFKGSIIEVSDKINSIIVDHFRKDFDKEDQDKNNQIQFSDLLRANHSPQTGGIQYFDIRQELMQIKLTNSKD